MIVLLVSDVVKCTIRCTQTSHLITSRSSDFQNSRLATPAAAYYYLRHFETSGRQLLSSRRRLRHLFERPDICAAQTAVHTLIHVEGLDSYGQWSYRVLTRIEMPRATTSAGGAVYQVGFARQSA